LLTENVLPFQGSGVLRQMHTTKFNAKFLKSMTLG